METTIDWVVTPVDHKYELPVLEVKVTLPPAQKVVDPLAVIVGVAGAGFTVTVVPALAALEQPEAFVTRTVYVPEVETTIDCVVAPVDHK